MEIALVLLFGAAFSWVTLVILIAIGQKLADLSVPPWPETLWKLAVIAIVYNALAAVLEPVNWLLSIVIGAVVFWTLMVKWFQVDFLGATILVVLSTVIQFALLAALGGVIVRIVG